MPSYIYKITNLINNKTYVGQYTGCEYGFQKYFGGGLALKKAFKKYGKENFKKEIIIEGDFNSDLLNELERHYIRLYSPAKTKNSYNILKGGKSHHITNILKIKKVYQFDTDGNFINEWEKSSDAAKKFNVSIDCIAAAARGDVLTACGFLWAYAKEDIGEKINGLKESEIIKKESCIKHIVWIFKDEVWYQFNGAVEAGEFLKCATPCIYKCIKDAKGYHWYKEILISTKKLDTIPTSKYRERKINKINQFDLNFKLIKTWDGIKEISLKLDPEGNNKYLRIGVCRNLSGNRKSAHGFIWSYAE